MPSGWWASASPSGRSANSLTADGLSTSAAAATSTTHWSKSPSPSSILNSPITTD